MKTEQMTFYHILTIISPVRMLRHMPGFGQSQK